MKKYFIFYLLGHFCFFCLEEMTIYAKVIYTTTMEKVPASS